MSFFIDTSL